MFDRLPTPFGLVRAGVAPDHPKIKSVIRVYEKTAAREGFRFFGNVEVGRDVTRRRARRALPRRDLRVRRRDRPPARDPRRGPARAAMPATAFVAWYNAPPGLRRPRVRPLLRARRRDRQRQRRHRRRPDARADRARSCEAPTPPTTRSTRWPMRAIARSSSSAAAARRRRRSPIPSCASSARWWTPTSTSTRPSSSSTRSAARTSTPTRPTSRRARTSRSSPSSRARAGGQAAADRAALPRAPRSRSRATARSSASWSARNELLPRRVGRDPGRATPASARRSSAGSCCARSATRASALDGVPFDERRGMIPNEGGRVIDGERPA